MAKKKSNPVGRPKEGTDSLPEFWYQDVLGLYKEGGSDVEIKAMIYGWRKAYSNDLWERWMKDEAQFSETIKMGRLLSQAWWIKNGRTNLMVKDFNYTGWYMNMKNRFGWKDKTEIDQTVRDVTPLSQEEIDQAGKKLDDKY